MLLSPLLFPLILDLLINVSSHFKSNYKVTCFAGVVHKKKATFILHGEDPAVGWEGWGSCCLWGPVPEGWSPWYRAMLEQRLESCSQWEAHERPVQEGWRPVGGTLCGAGAE